jgi:deoxyribonuclease V
MKINELHSWNVTPTEAVALQRQLAARVDKHSPLTQIELVAGADVSYARFSNRFCGAVVVLRALDFTLIEQQSVEMDVAFPYVPGLLSFRESPVLLAAFAKLRARPDVVLVDGQGIAHPRRFGLASHLGLWLDTPTIGCAKSLLCGKHRAPGQKRGAAARLRDRDETIGAVLRTRDRTRPLYVSVGHRIDLKSALRIVLSCGRGYRLPEPTRQAHVLVNEVRKGRALDGSAEPASGR